MEQWIELILNQWRQEGVELNPPAALASIEKAQSIINFNFPDDFKLLYSVVDGFKDFEWRNSMISLWSLDKIIGNYDETTDYIVISDFFISVCQYGFDKDSKEIYKTYSHSQKGPAEIIAQSFQGFLKLINCDSATLF
ncbi:SMI1/KNR4 family protein [Mucilaginibacter lacusdianchii]|uniref:SMI1/KNR4 family protein n=1 Tax=Mucilaginibacter lacusdianchii TaxID=2684211 RepID=UPI00131CC7B0|nr:SMI1/KNR4 family protein [Mucilaginibacter sp. JXJ CY 39]